MLRVKAFAKINLVLQILGKRSDGYHELDSLMQSVSLFDEIFIEHTQTPSTFGRGRLHVISSCQKLGESESQIVLTLSDPTIPADSKNTAYKGAQLFFNKIGEPPSVKIHIQKNIPSEAGLAGGSADGAGVLYGLNKLYGNPLKEDELLELCAMIGSDVSFCLVGGLCRCRGRGEILQKIGGKEFLKELYGISNLYIVIVKPDFSISTKFIYDNLVAGEYFEDEKKLVVDDFLSKKNLVLYNDLEKPAIEKFQEIASIKKKLREFGSFDSLMSGSGSAIYGLFLSHSTAKEAVGRFGRGWVVECVGDGVFAS